MAEFSNEEECSSLWARCVIDDFVTFVNIEPIIAVESRLAEPVKGDEPVRRMESNLQDETVKTPPETSHETRVLLSY